MPVSAVLPVVVPAARPDFVLSGPASNRVCEPERPWGTSHSPAFPARDVRGHIFEAQVELNQAWNMLEVLVRLGAEGGAAEAPPTEGWCGLLSAIQEHVGLARQQLARWRSEGVD